MSLVAAFVECAERQYRVDWAAVQRSVSERLDLAPVDVAILDPWRHPTYWCVPILVGSYLGSSVDAVSRDVPTFLSGCVMHELMFAPTRSFATGADSEVFQAVADAYAGCSVGESGLFDARFSAKCRPWTVLLAVGTRSIGTEAGSDHPDYRAAMAAIVLVYSLLQVVDDWHDRGEDLIRGHWNMWTDAPVVEPLAVVEPLLHGARTAVERLRPHLLRRALGAQMHDTAEELADIVHRHERVHG